MSSKIAGLGEIEGAKHLVALAQKWKKSADAMLKVAGQEPNAGPSTVEFAKAQALASNDEVKTAEAYLAEVEQRWEVVDVDKEGAPSTPGAPQTQKTRDEDQPDAAPTAANVIAASSSSDGSQNNADSDDDVIVIDDDESPNGAGATAADTEASGRAPEPARAPRVKNEATNLDVASSEEEIPFEVTVEGCSSKISSINGSYTLIGYHDEAPKYSKPDDEGGTCTIFRGTTYSGGLDVKKWFLMQDGTCFYTARADETSKLPPQNNWRVVTSGRVMVHDNGCTIYRGRAVLPSPKLIVEPLGQADDFVSDNGETIEELVASGCGVDSVNGEYKQRGYSDGVPVYYKTKNGIPCAKIHRVDRYAYVEGQPKKVKLWYVSIHKEGGGWDCSHRTHNVTEDLPIARRWVLYCIGDCICDPLQVRAKGTVGDRPRKRRRVIGGLNGL